jgi:hypothetical protein
MCLLLVQGVKKFSAAAAIGDCCANDPSNLTARHISATDISVAEREFYERERREAV